MGSHDWRRGPGNPDQATSARAVAPRPLIDENPRDNADRLNLGLTARLGDTGSQRL